MSRILLLLIFLLWMAWTPQTAASVGVAADPRVGPVVFVGFYALLVGLMRVWSELLARRVAHHNLNRSLRAFGRVLLAARVMVPAWFGIGLFLFGWGRIVDGITGRFAPAQLPGVLVGTFPAFLAWAGLWWSQYPADRSLREHSLLDELEADLPVHAPPSFGSYFTSNLRLQLLFTAAPVLAILLIRDVLAVAVRAARGPGAEVLEPLEFLTMLLSTGLVFVFAPELLRRVLHTQPLPDSPLRRRLEAMCARVGMRYRDILLWRTHNNMGNAAVMGIAPPVRYILLSDLLLERMDDEQIEAVFAHEVGHVVHRHMAWYVVVVLIFTLTLLSAERFMPKDLSVLAGVPQGLVDVLSLLATLGMFLVYFGFLSRRFERQADVYAARVIESNARGSSGFRVQGSVAGLLALSASPEPRTLNHEPSRGPSHVGPYGATVFASALHRVALMNNIPLTPRRAPRGGVVRRIGHAVDGAVESVHNWLHGSIHHRMEYLRDLSADPALTGRFDRFMVGLYCTLLFVLFACAAFVVASGPLFR